MSSANMKFEAYWNKKGKHREIKNFHYLYKEHPEEKIKAKKCALTGGENNLENSENKNIR